MWVVVYAVYVGSVGVTDVFAAVALAWFGGGWRWLAVVAVVWRGLGRPGTPGAGQVGDAGVGKVGDGCVDDKCVGGLCVGWRRRVRGDAWVMATGGVGSGLVMGRLCGCVWLRVARWYAGTPCLLQSRAWLHIPTPEFHRRLAFPGKSCVEPLSPPKNNQGVGTRIRLEREWPAAPSRAPWHRWRREPEARRPTAPPRHRARGGPVSRP